MHDVNLLGPQGQFKFPEELLSRLGWRGGERLQTVLSPSGTHLRTYLAPKVCCLCGNEHIHDLLETRFDSAVCLGCLADLNRRRKQSAEEMWARYTAPLPPPREPEPIVIKEPIQAVNTGLGNLE